MIKTIYQQFIYFLILTLIALPSVGASMTLALKEQTPTWQLSMLIDFSQTCPLRHSGLDLIHMERHATNKLCLYGVSTQQES